MVAPRGASHAPRPSRSGVLRTAAMKMLGRLTERVFRAYAIVAERDLEDAGAKLAALHQQDQQDRGPPPVSGLRKVRDKVARRVIGSAGSSVAN